jgi:hypothetical protein
MNMVATSRKAKQTTTLSRVIPTMAALISPW